MSPTAPERPSTDEAGQRAKPDISITFPCYNEEANVAKMIEMSLAVLKRIANRYEVVVSNDGSKDRTKEISEQYSVKYPDVVRVINQYPNKGYGHALKAGLRAGRYDWVFFTDGDCQFNLEEMDRLVPFLPDHDIVTGYRENRQDPIHRRINSTGWNILGRLLLGITVRDVNCAFRFYRKTFLDSIPIESDGAMINQEVYARAHKMKIRIKEVPVTHLPRVAGTQTGANPGVIFKAFSELYSLRNKLK